MIEISRLKKLRMQKKYSQEQIQILTGIDQSDYSKLENERRNLSFEQCRRLAIVLDTSMDYLAGLTDDPRPYARSVRQKRS